MNDWMQLIVPLSGGILLGVVYFLGLWWTVGRLSRTARPLNFYLLSFGIRLACLLLAFYFLLNVGPLALITALVGFMVTRFALVRSLGLTTQTGLKLDSASTSATPTKTGAG